MDETQLSQTSGIYFWKLRVILLMNIEIYSFFIFLGRGGGGYGGYGGKFYSFKDIT